MPHDPHPWGAEWPVDLAGPVDRAHPVNDGRLAWWLALPGWMGGRTWYDLLGLCHVSYAAGFTDAAEGWRGTARPGGLGELRALSGLGYLQAGACPSLQVQSHTFAAWVRPNSGDNQAVLSRASITTDGYEWAITTLVFSWAYYDGAVRGYYSGPTLTGGTWQHVAGTWDRQAGLVQFYLNGVPAGGPVATTTGSIVHDAARPLRIGWEPFGQKYTGVLDDLSVWGRVLTAAQVRGVYDLSRAGYPGVLNRVSPPAAPAPGPAGGPFPHYTRRRLSGGTITMGG